MNAGPTGGMNAAVAGRLDGRVALITGGTGGIGAATVRRFVAEGAWVVASGRSHERGAELVRELGDQVRFVAADVTRAEQIDTLIDETVAWRGRLDILFNNAGETQAPASLLALEPAVLLQLRMTPPCPRMARAALRVASTTLVNRVSISARRCAGSSASSDAGACASPALLKRTSSRPRQATVVSTSASICSGRVTSAATNRT